MRAFATLQLFLLAVLVAQGQEEDTGRAASFKVGAVRIVDGKSSVWMRTGEDRKVIECPLSVRGFGMPISLRDAGPRVQFFATREEAEAEEGPKPLAQFARSDLLDRLLLFLPGRGGYRAVSISGEEFDYGGFLVANYLPVAVVVKTGDAAPRRVEAGKRHGIPSAGGKSIAVRLGVVRNDGSVKLFRSAKWQLSPRQRELVVIYGDPERPSTHHLMDRAPLQAANE